MPWQRGRTWADHLFRGRGTGRSADLLVVCGNCRDLLVIEFLGEQPHRLGIVSAEAALPHAQLERGVVRILSSEIWNGRRLPRAGRAVAVATAGDPFRLVATLGELFTFLGEIR